MTAPVAAPAVVRAADSEEFHAALRRLAAVLTEHPGQGMETVVHARNAGIDMVRGALLAALDVEEMAREMVKHQRVAPYSERQCMCGVTVSSKETGAEHVAAALRASILGSDQ